MKSSVCKGCKVFAIYLMDDNEKYNQLKIEDITILKYFKNIFLEEVLRLPPKRDIDFTTDLVLRVLPSLKSPCQMNITNITKLKSQL